jgi:excisionase family DNA binding protein
MEEFTLNMALGFGLVSSSETAEMLGIHQKTLERMARQGDIPAIKIGKKWKFRQSTVEGWLIKQENVHSQSVASETGDCQ